MTRTRQFWMLQTGAWPGYGLENVIAGLGMDRTVSYYQFAFYDAACGFVFTLVIREGVRRSWDWPLRSRLWLGASLLVSTSLVYAFLWAAGISEICIECKPPPYAIGYVSFFAGALCLMLAWTGGYVGVKLALQLQQEKEAALRATAMAHQAQLRMLRYQLNPHFLFNTLNAISTLVLENRREQANGMVGALSGFLRHSLDSDPEQKVTLEQEIGAIRRYLAIEQLRFGERLRIDIDVHPHAGTARVPGLILQPLIENAVKFAVSPREQGGHVRIVAGVDGRVLEITLCDDGPGSPDYESSEPGRHGVGLANTRERLHVLYGERHEFTIRRLQPQGTQVRLRIPFE